jgi:CheY-like chemotaxis protein
MCQTQISQPILGAKTLKFVSHSADCQITEEPYPVWVEMTSSKPTLLCVDDNQTALHLRKLILESAGYSVLVASDSMTAMELLSSSAVHLVLSDYHLPDGTGIELAASMKRLKPDVPIAIISGMMEAPEGMEHADLFICKTDSPPLVLQKISELLKCRT